MVEGVSKFGPVVKRYCLCIIYYLWAFSYPEDIRRRKIDLTTDASRRDLLGAVKPFIEEISAALDDPRCQGAERQMLEDFASSYEDVLELVGLPIERVDPNWDQFQITADNKLNSALFHFFRGMDLYQQGNMELAKDHLIPGFERLVRIEKRRALPGALRRLVRDNQDLVGKFERDLRDARERGESVLEPSGLPSVEDLIQARKEGRTPGLADMKPPEPEPGPPPPPAPEMTEGGLVMALEGQVSEVSPPEPEPEEDGLLDIPLTGPPPRPFHDPDESSDSSIEMKILSEPPGDIDTLPPVDLASLPPVEEEDNPWADITEETHVTPDEFVQTQQPISDADSLVDPPEEPGVSTEVSGDDEAGKTESDIRRAIEGPPPPDPSRTTVPDGSKVHNASKPPEEAAKHSELAELFDDE